MFRPASQRTVTQPMAHPLASQAPTAIEQRAVQVASQLPLPARRVLTDACGPHWFHQAVPFVPHHPQAQEVAQWLAREVGALSPVPYGVHTAYQPTLLGLAILWSYLQQVSQHAPQMSSRW